ncbi:MAG TPA: hypothetical protein VFC79_14185 [Tissierellaceae bacterium]|nr:hypothetical protein [Tissierellaceae bacterium]
MKRYFYGNSYKVKKIIGISLGIIGFLILINVMSTKFLFLLVGLGLILMGILLYMK